MFIFFKVNASTFIKILGQKRKNFHAQLTNLFKFDINLYLYILLKDSYHYFVSLYVEYLILGYYLFIVNIIEYI